MSWDYSFSEAAFRELKKLDRPTQTRILNYFDQRIQTDEDPRRFGKALKGGLSGFWRYRVGDYRIICEIKDDQLVVLVLRVGHRRKIYE